MRMCGRGKGCGLVAYAGPVSGENIGLSVHLFPCGGVGGRFILYVVPLASPPALYVYAQYSPLSVPGSIPAGTGLFEVYPPPLWVTTLRASYPFELSHTPQKRGT